ncbi:MAG: O-antigen ligase family protein [Clostridia bacterium]|nr:O-antigen ligase family protein [Clostridia bacterium]
MARKRTNEITGFHRVYEKALVIGAVLLMTYHMWISFARHYFAPENMINKSSIAQMLLQIDKYLAAALLCAGILYIFIVRIKFARTWVRIKNFFYQTVSKEWIMLIILFAWYMICCLVHGKGTTKLIHSYGLWIIDMAISILFLFPLGKAVGVARVRKWVEAAMHVIMACSTCFIVWALVHLFQLDIITLPNGLELGMTSNYAFYAGVNQNIGAAIGVCMSLISVYMITTQRWYVKICYSIVLIPHLAATLLTNSRGSYLSLQIALPIVAFMAVWNATRKWKMVKRAAISGATAIIAAVFFCWLRSAMFDLFEAITHLGEMIDKEAGDSVRELEAETGRLRIWHSSLVVLVSSAKNFFFGVPTGDISYVIKDVMTEIYGEGQLYAHAHNSILQIGLSMGVPAMMLFISFLVMLSIRCVRVGVGLAKNCFPGAYVLPAAVLAMVIINMVEAFLFFYISITACIFFLFGGWISALNDKRKL